MFLSGLRLRFHLPTTAAPLGPMDLNSAYNRSLGGAEISGPGGVRRPVFAWIQLNFQIKEQLTEKSEKSSCCNWRDTQPTPWTALTDMDIL